jgi:XTP/dITP diphosphohydrolase
MLQTILLATNNQHKLREVRQILEPCGLVVLSADDVGGLPKVVEDGETFADNAIKKAISGMQHANLPTIGDDSGIEARALNWEPGVQSARYAGADCDDEANNRKLVDVLRDEADRFVQYRCVIALARTTGEVNTFEGTFPGELVLEPRGSGGFGYDPYVLIPELGQTVAELSDDEKHARSHRGQALRAFVDWLESE